PGGAQQLGIVTGLEDLLPNTTDWYGRWRPRSSAENDYLMDRGRQRSNSFSGIPGIAAEDQAVTESMGRIVNRSAEHLAPSDQMIAVTRRRLLDAVTAFDKTGELPLANAETYGQVRGGYFVAAAGKSLVEAYEEARATTGAKPAVSPV